MDNPLSEAAHRYAASGLAVFPLQPRKKVPDTPHGCKDATTDAGVVEEWWERNPAHNVGIATGGPSGVFVIDLDVDEAKGKDGLAALGEWEREHGKLPETATAGTGGGGVHLYYRTDKDIRNATNAGLGIDVRGEGGYVVAPPSVHPDGTAYEWAIPPEDAGIAQADGNVLALVAFVSGSRSSAAIEGGAGGSGGPGQTCGRFALPDEIPDGERNDTLMRYAASMQAQGVPDAVIMAATLDANAARCKPPQGSAEVRRAVESVLRYPKGEPLGACRDAGAAWAWNSERMDEMLAAMAKHTLVSPTGIPSLDSILGGGLYAEMYVLAAEPATGKTALALQIADAVAQTSGRGVLFFSQELSAPFIVARSLARIASKMGESPVSARMVIDPRMMDENQQKALDGAKALYRDAIAPHIATIDGHVSATQVSKVVREAADALPEPPVVFLDYLQIMATGESEAATASDYQRHTANMNALLDISSGYPAPVFVISSLNRKRGGTCGLETFAGTSSIEYGASVAMFLARPDDDGEPPASPGQPSQRDVVLKVAKNRNGATGDVSLRFHLAGGWFSDPARRKPPAIEGGWQKGALEI